MHQAIKQVINLCVSLESSVTAETISYFTLGDRLIKEALELQSVENFATLWSYDQAINC